MTLTDFNINSSGLPSAITIYDCEVNGDGSADYTTLSAAVTAGKKRILLSGNTTEVANIPTASDVIIDSTSSANTVDLGTTYQFGLVTNCMFQNFSISSIRTSGGLFNSTVTGALFRNIKFVGEPATIGSACFVSNIVGGKFEQCSLVPTKRSFIDYTSVAQWSVLCENCDFIYTGIGSGGKLVRVNMDSSSRNAHLQFDNCAFNGTGNIIDASTNANGYASILLNNCTGVESATGASAMFRVVLVNFTIVGGAYYKNGDSLFTVASGGNIAVIGARISATRFIQNEVNNYSMSIQGCYLNGASGMSGLGNYTTGASGTEALVTLSGNYNNGGTDKYTADREIMRMQNISGGTLNAGDVVKITADTGGIPAITTTTTVDDPDVYGVVMANITTGSYGPVLLKGYCSRIKVNGVTDIAIGDKLGTYSEVKIAAKTTTAGRGFAIALSAYTTDNSSGIISGILLGSVR